MAVHSPEPRLSILSDIETLVNSTAWKESDVTVSKLDTLIHNNLRRIVSQIGNEYLHNALVKLSSRIIEEFDSQGARSLSFEIMGIALGIFSKGKKHPWDMLPAEIWQVVFSFLTPGEEGVDVSNISSGLKNAAFTSKKFHQWAFEVKKQWVNRHGISLRTFGCTTAAAAVECIVKYNLKTANLSDYPAVTDLDLAKVITSCPRITKLFLRNAPVTDLSIRLISGLTHLEELSLIECRAINEVNLSECAELRKVRCITCITLQSFKLPTTASGLKQVDCIWSSLTFKSRVSNHERYAAFITGLL